MQYLGGKYHMAKKIAALVASVRPPGATYFEPFLGGGSVLCAMPTHWPRVASDVNPCLITMWKAIQSGWEPPHEVSEEEYSRLKVIKDPDDPLTAFVGFGCSFGGRFFEGYARGRGHNYAGQTRRNLEKKRPALQGVDLRCCTYSDLDIPPGSIVYADPPYEGTKWYSGTKPFDHVRFWDWVRGRESEGTPVLVSEYSAPDDFDPVFEKGHPVRIKGGKGAGEKPRAVEKVFRFKGTERGDEGDPVSLFDLYDNRLD